MNQSQVSPKGIRSNYPISGQQPIGNQPQQVQNMDNPYQLIPLRNKYNLTVLAGLSHDFIFNPIYSSTKSILIQSLNLINAKDLHVSINKNYNTILQSYPIKSDNETISGFNIFQQERDKIEIKLWNPTSDHKDVTLYVEGIERNVDHNERDGYRNKPIVPPFTDEALHERISSLESKITTLTEKFSPLSKVLEILEFNPPCGENCNLQHLWDSPFIFYQICYHCPRKTTRVMDDDQ